MQGRTTAPAFGESKIKADPDLLRIGLDFLVELSGLAYYGADLMSAPA